MHFTQAIATAAGFLAFGQLVAAVPQTTNNAGNGNAVTNVCDMRGKPEFIHAPGPGPRVDSCKHLAKLFRKQQVFGKQTVIKKGGRSFTSGDCSFIAECPVFQDGVEYLVGSDDLADLMDSAIADFNAAGGQTFSEVKNQAHFVIDGENNVVSCQRNDESKKLINVKYTIRGRTTGRTLPSQ